jgi:4-methyl-5(b-hydroxyethyl)-thiazole monophosphate biosynthesis
MFEIMLASELISKTHPIEIATVNGQSLISSTGMIFQAHKAYQDVDVSDYSCLLVPGGDTYDVIENEVLQIILRTAESKGIWIGAICAGPLLLANAGILKGRRFTHGFGDHYKDFLELYWDGANFVDEAVVEDNKVLTAKPEAHVDFGVKLASLVGAIPEDRVEYYRNYYKGNRLPQLAEVENG